MAAPPSPRQPRRPPELIDELVEEILLCLPPDKSACLVHAALVCKRWCRVVMDPSFRHRFRQFHRTPPMLGFIVDRHSRGTHFLPCSSFRPSDVDCRSWCPLDARHGRILFDYSPVRTNAKKQELIVWTPVTGEVRRLLAMLRFLSSLGVYWNAALLCVAPGCNHMECPSGGPFNVVLVGSTWLMSSTNAYVYSSEAAEWSETASTEQRGYVLHLTCNALVGNTIYFLQFQNVGIMEYDLVKKELSVIRLPPICNRSTIIVLMSVEDGGGLGFAMMHGFSLCIWLWESAPTTSGGWTWMQHKVVDLKSFLPSTNLTSPSYIIAAADAVGVFVIWARGAGVVAIDVKSGLGRKLFHDNIIYI